MLTTMSITIRKLDSTQDDFQETLDEALQLGERMKPMTADVSAEVNALIRAGKRLMFEGAQAALLDIDHGTYPFVTSSNCVAGQASAGGSWWLPW